MSVIKPGTLCFAKIRGYSPWPARVNTLPIDVKLPPGKVPVFFYGTHQVSYVSEPDIYEYEKYKTIYGGFKERNGRFNEGMEELEKNPKILQLGYDKDAINFLSKYYKFDEKKAEELYNCTCIDIVKEKKDQTVPINPRKRRMSRSSEVEKKKKVKTDKFSSVIKSDLCIELHKLEMATVNNENGAIDQNNETKIKTISLHNKVDEFVPIDKIMSQRKVNDVERKSIDDNAATQSVIVNSDDPFVDRSETKSQFIDNNQSSQSLFDKSDPESTDENTDSDTNIPKYTEPTTKSLETFKVVQPKNPTINTIPFKSPVENAETSRPKRASAIKFQESLQSFKREIAPKSSVSDDIAKIKVSNSRNEEKVPRQMSTHHTKRNKESSVNRSHSVSQHPIAPVINEEERQLRIVSQLSVIDKEIKRTLIVGNENYDMCKKLLKKLDDMKDINLVFLCKVPEIVTTLRKCRRYKKDDSIKASASEIYQRFYQIYDKSDIDEKIEAGTELLKRDKSNCKSAQTLMDEMFVCDSKTLSSRQVSIPSIVLSSPSSAVSHQSSCANTPLLVPLEQPDTADTIISNINELLANGTMQLIESYDADNGYSGYGDEKQGFGKQADMFEILGV